MKFRNAQAKRVYDNLIFSMSLCVIVRFVLERKKLVEAADIFFLIAMGLVLAALILWLFDRFAPRWFGNKPSREELDKLNNE
jgi:hypothetical protein